jgi:hypothetical protein
MSKAKIQDQIVEGQFSGPLNGAMGLVRRFQEVPGFRGYVRDRMVAVGPIVVLMVLTSIGCAFATIMYIGGTRSALVLLAMLLVPFVLLGSFFVQAYVFFSWLESRALAEALHHSLKPPGPIALKLRKAGFDMGSMPPVPWVLTVIFLFLPLAMLLAVMPLMAFTLILLLVLAPFVFARLDR